MDDYIVERRNLCHQCEHYKTIIGVKTCEVCGCVIRWKTQLKNSECPIGKWGKINDDSSCAS